MLMNLLLATKRLQVFHCLAIVYALYLPLVDIIQTEQCQDSGILWKVNSMILQHVPVKYFLHLLLHQQLLLLLRQLQH